MTLTTPDLAIAQARAAETVFMMRGDGGRAALQASAAFERARPWADKRPAL